MNRKERIEKLMSDGMAFERMEVIDESASHNEGNESHYQLLVVSKEFDSLSLVKRHQKIYKILQPEFDQGLHALSIQSLTPAEFAAQTASIDSPDCLGGGR